MTEDAKVLLQIHAQGPDRPRYALLETAWDKHRLDPAYLELVYAGYIEASTTDTFVVNNVASLKYKLTAKGLAASKKSN